MHTVIVIILVVILIGAFAFFKLTEKFVATDQQQQPKSSYYASRLDDRKYDSNNNFYPETLLPFEYDKFITNNNLVPMKNCSTSSIFPNPSAYSYTTPAYSSSSCGCN